MTLRAKLGVRIPVEVRQMIGTYFCLNEMVASKEARKRGLDNTPSRKEIKNLTALVKNVLDPLRMVYGKPIHVASGYKCAELNKLQGGAKKSQHVTGEAVDIIGHPKTKLENMKLFKLIQEMDLPYDKLIDEKSMCWVHVSHTTKRRNKKHVLHFIK